MESVTVVEVKSKLPSDLRTKQERKITAKLPKCAQSLCFDSYKRKSTFPAATESTIQTKTNNKAITVT